MKTRTLALFSSLCLFLLTSATFAWQEEFRGACNPYESKCQCVDPSCNAPYAFDSNCISRAECCEAFGNIGAR